MGCNSSSEAGPATKNNSAAPAKTNSSPEPANTNSSPEPAKTNSSAEPAKTNSSPEPAKTIGSAEPAKTNSSAATAKTESPAKPAKECSPKSIKVYYFDLTGRGEAVRANLIVGGVEFEDVRLPQGPEWVEFKPKTPFGGMPVIEVDGTMVAQSTTCARFSARLAGLAGTSVFEEALADSVVDTVTEIREKGFSVAFMEDEEQKKAAVDDFQTNFLPMKLDFLEKFVCEHNDGEDGFFCGGKLTWADLYFVVHMEMLGTVMKLAPSDPTWDEGRPKLKTLNERVRADPRVKAYHAKEAARTK